MRPVVNLANDPFRNRRLFWVVVLLLFLVPFYLGLMAIESATRLEGEIVTHRIAVKGLEDRLKKFDKPVTSKVTVSPEENRQLVAASELIARRTFSWSQLLNDIERSLPASVRVLRVAVAQVPLQERAATIGGDESAATLGLTVIGKSGQDVTTMINRFHELGRFKVAPIAKKAIEGTEDVEFELRVEYFPPLSAPRASLGTQIASKETPEKKQ